MGHHNLFELPSIQELFLVSGHHGKVTGMSFSGGSDQDSPRYVATVSGEHIMQHGVRFSPYTCLFEMTRC